MAVKLRSSRSGAAGGVVRAPPPCLAASVIRFQPPCASMLRQRGCGRYSPGARTSDIGRGPSSMPAAKEKLSRGVGTERACDLRGGITITERWVAWEEGRSFTYEGAGIPLVARARNRWSVRPESGDRALLTSHSEVVLKGGVAGRCSSRSSRFSSIASRRGHLRRSGVSSSTVSLRRSSTHGCHGSASPVSAVRCVEFVPNAR